MATVTKPSDPIGQLKSNGKSPESVVSRKRDRIIAIVVLVSVVALVALMIALASMGDGGAAGDANDWFTIPY